MLPETIYGQPIGLLANWLGATVAVCGIVAYIIRLHVLLHRLRKNHQHGGR